MEEMEQRLQALEAQIAQLASVADEQAISQLVMTYGPMVDAGGSEDVSELWEADGVYDVAGVRTMTGREEIAEMFRSASHRAFIDNGCAHFLSSPLVRVDNDHAEAFNHSALFISEGDGLKIYRIAANHWTFRKHPDGWQIIKRVNRPLDGTEDSRRLLADIRTEIL